jgi:hypothetical protein
MRFSIKARDVPPRVATGAFILHSGLEKWHADEAHAAAVHGMAAGAFPVFNDVPAPRFARLFAAGEVALGVALLAPIVPSAVAGAALTGFAGGFAAMYMRTPALRKPGSVWPSEAGIGVSKDVWMLGIGLGLLADSLACCGRDHR